MEPLKKKLFGYDAEKVDKTIKELNEEVFSLRQELFSVEKEDMEKNVYDTSFEEEKVYLKAEIEALKKNIAEKDAVISRLHNDVAARDNELRRRENELAVSKGQQAFGQLRPGKVLNEQAVRDAILAYKEAIAAKDNSLKSLQDTVNALNEKISDLESKNKELETASADANARKFSLPDMKLIENVYMRAFSGAKAIADDARSSISNLTDRVFLDLSSDISNTARLYDELRASKDEVANFINAGIANFKSLEKLVNTISDANMNTAEHVKKLSESRDKIISEVNEAVGSFEIDIGESITFNAKNAVNEQDELRAISANDKAEAATPVTPVEVLNEETPLEADMTPNIDVDFSMDALFIDAPAVEEDESVINKEYAPESSFTNSAATIDSETKNPAPNEVKPEQGFEADTQFNINQKNDFVPNVFLIDETNISFSEEDGESLSNQNLIDGDDDGNDSYDPDNELNEMRKAIKRSIEEKKKKEEDDKDETQKSVADKGAANNADANDAPVRPKINVQDILKKYSNLN